MAYLLSIGYSDLNKPFEIVLGDYSWNKYKVVNLLEASTFNIVNAGITNSLSLVPLHGDWSRYTAYNVNTKRITHKAYTVLAVNNKDKYLISDGITHPEWLDLDSIIYDIQENNYGLSNCNLKNGKLVPIAGNFNVIDY